MKKYYLYFSFLIMALFVLNSCRNEILDDQIKENDSKNIEMRAAFSDARFYWHKGRKVYLFPDRKKEYIVYKASNEVSVFRNMQITAQSDIKGGVLDYNVSSRSTPVHKLLKDDLLKWAVIPKTSDLRSNSEILYHGDFFTNELGESVGLSHLLYVKLKSESDLKKLKRYADKYGVTIMHKNKFMPLWYTLSALNSSFTTLELANIFYETGEFDSAQPDILVDEDLLYKAPNDPLFPKQWGLKNTGQNNGIEGIDIAFDQVQKITSGNANIIVAVIDQGIERNHPDLNLHTLSYDTHNGTSPSIIRGNHGTACAGIIGAKNNNSLGITGIAPECPLMSISHKLIPGSNLAEELADGFSFAWKNGASVISNSWGGLSPSEILEDAINDALQKGREGKGCVIVFASGNDNSSEVSYPASSIPDILAVGAMSPCGERKSPTSCDGEYWWGSNYGRTLDIVAPGVKIPTTDLIGARGYSQDDYYLRFNGTSSACPHVAAVAALILSVKPELSQQAVATAILKSARKLSNYSFNEQKEYGSWSKEVGYGLLNSVGAVQYAMGNDIVHFDNQFVSSFQTVFGRTIYSENVIVRDKSKLIFEAQDQIVITPPFTVEKGSVFEMRF